MHIDQLLYIVPAALFALGGVTLWWRRRSLPTLLIAVGFVGTLTAELASLIGAYNIQAAVHANPSLVVPQSHIVPLIVHYLGLPGFWAAAVGLVWHAFASR